MNQFQNYAHNNDNAYNMHIIYHCKSPSLFIYTHRLFFMCHRNLILKQSR